MALHPIQKTMKHKLFVEYNNFVADNGFDSISRTDDVTVLNFNNEVYIRFLDIGIERGDLTSPQPFSVELYDDDYNIANKFLRENDIEFLLLEPTKRFHRVISDLFRKFLINDDNIYQYIFRIFRRPAYSRQDLPAFWGISIAKHDKNLPKFGNSPSNSELLLAEFNDFWSKNEQILAKKFLEYSLDLDSPATRRQFFAFFGEMDKKWSTRASRARLTELWERRKEMGIL